MTDWISAILHPGRETPVFEVRLVFTEGRWFASVKIEDFSAWIHADGDSSPSAALEKAVALSESWVAFGEARERATALVGAFR